MAQTAKEAILKKHPAMTEAEVEAEKKRKIELNESIDRSNSVREKNLIEYFQKTEPIVDENGNQLALMRYPSYDELVSIIPPELAKYKEHPELIPPELAASVSEKYAGAEFDLMAKLIVDPKKPAEWWKKQHGITRFIKLFNDTLQKVVTLQSKEAVGFPKARKGKP